MSSPPKSLSPILHAHRLSPSPSPLALPPRDPSPPTDIALQIAAVTRDLADLRAEERRLLHARVPPQQEVRRITIVIVPRCGSLRLSLTLVC